MLLPSGPRHSRPRRSGSALLDGSLLARALLTGTLAAGALLAGALIAGCDRERTDLVRREHDGDDAPEGRSALPVIRPADAEEILAAVHAGDGEAVLLNVWATWCVPCREEFPDLVRVAREYEPLGLRLVLVSADFDSQIDAARGFLADQGVERPSFLKTGGDMEFIDALDPEWSGALPATWIYDGTGTRRFFWTDRASYDTLRSRVRAVLGDLPG